MKRFNISAITTWTDNEGKERKNYADCGTAFINDTQDGKQVINLKFDFIPTAAAGRSLEIACFEPKAKKNNDGDAND